MDYMQKQRLESVKSGKMRVGKNKLLAYLEGKKTTPINAIKAKCYDCNGMGESDKCSDTACSLFPYTQFRVRAQSEKRKAPVHGFKRKERVEQANRVAS
jgi:hypothetical protein